MRSPGRPSGSLLPKSRALVKLARDLDPPFRCRLRATIFQRSFLGKTEDDASQLNRLGVAYFHLCLLPISATHYKAWLILTKLVGAQCQRVLRSRPRFGRVGKTLLSFSSWAEPNFLAPDCNPRSCGPPGEKIRNKTDAAAGCGQPPAKRHLSLPVTILRGITRSHPEHGS